MKKKIVCVSGAALLCSIHGATIKNTFFEDGDGANTFRDFNPIQSFLHLRKKLLFTRCGTWMNMLVIILLHNGYLLKYFFKNIYVDNIFYFLTFIFLYHHIKIMHKHKKILI
jgi:hypothetical protein